MQGLYTTLAGYLLCNGASYSTATYPQLFGIIGYSYGGSGASFNVPDFRGMFLRGNGSQTIGGVTYTGGSLSLAGRQQDQAMSASYATNQGFRSCAAGTRDAVSRAIITTDPVDTNTGILAQFARQGIETRPANYTVNFFIKF
jgi:microcystin-dependent protein